MRGTIIKLCCFSFEAVWALLADTTDGPFIILTYVNNKVPRHRSKLY